MPNRDLTPWTGARVPTAFGRDPFTLFQRQMDRLFDDFFAPAEARSFAADAAAWPKVDVHETDQAYRIVAEAPGMDEKDLELNLRDNALTISGERREESNEEDGGRRYAERYFGKFQRTIPLPAEVDADKVEATFKNGVLSVTLPKDAEARDKSRRIAIKSETAAN